MISTDNHSVFNELQANKKDIVGIDLFVAGGYEDAPVYSRWGHAFIVFIDKNEKYYNNTALSLVADIPSSELESTLTHLMLYPKAFVGIYPFTFELDYFYYFWQRYVLDEKRPLERISIPFPDQVKAKFFTLLEDYYKSPQKLGGYAFATNNCIVALAKLLKDSGIPLKSIPRIPLNTKDTMIESGLINAPIEKINSHVRNVPEIYKYLEHKEISNYGEFNFGLIDDLIELYGVASTYYIVENDIILFQKYSQYIIEKYADSTDFVRMQTGFSKNLESYVLCDNIKCAKGFSENQAKLYKSDQIAETNFLRHRSSLLVADNEKQNPYTKHLNLVVRNNKVHLKEKILLKAPKQHFDQIDYRIVDFYPSNNLLHLKIYLNKNTNDGDGHAERMKKAQQDFYISMQESDSLVFFRGKKCINLEQKRFLKNCGILYENGAYKLIAY